MELDFDDFLSLTGRHTAVHLAYALALRQMQSTAKDLLRKELSAVKTAIAPILRDPKVRENFIRACKEIDAEIGGHNLSQGRICQQCWERTISPFDRCPSCGAEDLFTLGV